MRVLVTGASGFAGGYLLSHLRLRGHEIVPFLLPGVADSRIDVRDAPAVLESLERTAPDGILHLAATANVVLADANAGQARDVNVLGTANVLDAARAIGARTLVVSSGVVYGQVPLEKLPVVESTPLAPVGSYAESKAAAEAECERRTELQDIVRVRAFNHTGPGQSSDYVCSAFARQIAEIENGDREPLITHGDLAPERDFCDVRDVVRAYCDVFEQGSTGEVYNVCSGIPISISKILEALAEMSHVPFKTVVAEERLRAQDVDRVYGCARKLQDELGWRSIIPLHTTLSDLLDDWRQRILQTCKSGVDTSK